MAWQLDRTVHRFVNPHLKLHYDPVKYIVGSSLHVFLAKSQQLICEEIDVLVHFHK